MDILPPKQKIPKKLAAKGPARAYSNNQKTFSSRAYKINKRQKNKSKLIRFSLVAINLIIFGAAGILVLTNSSDTIATYQPQKSLEINSNPLDSLSSADIAANIASMTGMPEALAVNNQANTISLYLNASVVEREFVTKSQILSPDIKSKEDIQKHKVLEGDTLASLARKYGVTSDSIAWSNDIRGDLIPGTVIFIPPVNGIVYQVAVNDTPEVLADRFSASAQELVAFNDAEITGLLAGDIIVIPNGIKPRTLSDILNYRASYGYNGYWYGYCTWYVANHIDMPNNWGDANTWDNYARVTPGWVVSQVPVVGSIAQSNRGPDGHVAIVEEVSEDGKMVKFSDMNGLAGWNRVGRTADWIELDGGFGFENFIYRSN